MRLLALELDRHKLGLGFWSQVDQGVVSLGSFLLGLILARALPPAEYGVYALVWSALLFLRGFHTSLVTYPLSVDWAKTEPGKLNALVGGSLALTIALGLPLMAGAAVAAVIVGRPGLVPWAMGALLAGHFQETTRRALMAGLRHRATVLGDSVSYLGQVAGLWAVASSRRLSVEAAFAAMALTSLVAGFIQLRQLGAPAFETRVLRALAARWWELGRWLLLATLLSVFTIQVFPWTVGLVRGPAEAGQYQAAANLLGATHPVLFGLGNLLVPAVAQARVCGGLSASWRVARWYGLLGAVLLVPYLGVLWVWPGEVLRLVYGTGSPYMALETEVRLFALAYATIYIGQLAGALLLGLEQSRASFWVTAACAAASVVVGMPLAAGYGVDGALAGLVVSRVAQVGSAIALIVRFTHSVRQQGLETVRM
jgi:O-antigen/teichoic acid export membrane protein